MILATDMAKHGQNLSALNAVITDKEIKDGNNVNLLVEDADESLKFKNQQQIMEMAVHSCDLSTPTRSFETMHEWVYLLFIEFFKQGDLEKQENLPVTFLCDRNTTNVAGSQPGFANFIVIPTFTAISNIMPSLHARLEQCKDNIKKWEAYVETDEDKQVYQKPIVIEEEKNESGSGGDQNISSEGEEKN